MGFGPAQGQVEADTLDAAADRGATTNQVLVTGGVDVPATTGKVSFGNVSSDDYAAFLASTSASNPVISAKRSSGTEFATLNGLNFIGKSSNGSNQDFSLRSATLPGLNLSSDSAVRWGSSATDSDSSLDNVLTRVAVAVTDIGLKLADATTGFREFVAAKVGGSNGTTLGAYLDHQGFWGASGSKFAWRSSSTDASAGTTDTQLVRGAAGQVDVLGTGTDKGDINFKNLVTDTTTGTKIGTATTQKIGFYNATPIVQGSSVADAAGGATVDAEARAAINAVISRLEALGLIATV